MMPHNNRRIHSLLPICSFLTKAQPNSNTNTKTTAIDQHPHQSAQYLQFVGRFAQVVALVGTGAGDEVLDQSDADVVAHAVQVLVDVLHALKVIEKLHHQRSVGEREELRVLTTENPKRQKKKTPAI